MDQGCTAANTNHHPSSSLQHHTALHINPLSSSSKAQRDVGRLWQVSQNEHTCTTKPFSDTIAKQGTEEDVGAKFDIPKPPKKNNPMKKKMKNTSSRFFIFGKASETEVGPSHGHSAIKEITLKLHKSIALYINNEAEHDLWALKDKPAGNYHQVPSSTEPSSLLQLVGLVLQRTYCLVRSHRSHLARRLVSTDKHNEH